MAAGRADEMDNNMERNDPNQVSAAMQGFPHCIKVFQNIVLLFRCFAVSLYQSCFAFRVLVTPGFKLSFKGG